jgi:hypothetical protein
MTDANGNILLPEQAIADYIAEPNVPYTRVKLAHYAQLLEDLFAADSALHSLTKTADRYKAALVKVSDLCTADDSARAYIGDIARTAINPIAAKPGQEAK